MLNEGRQDRDYFSSTVPGNHYRRRHSRQNEGRAEEVKLKNHLILLRSVLLKNVSFVVVIDLLEAELDSRLPIDSSVGSFSL